MLKLDRYIFDRADMLDKDVLEELSKSAHFVKKNDDGKTVGMFKFLPSLDYVITDENRNLLSWARRQVPSIGADYRLFDVNGNELCRTDQKVLHLNRQLEVYDTQNNLVGMVKKKDPTFGGAKYWLGSPNGTEIAQAKGDIHGLSYQIEAPDGKLLARVNVAPSEIKRARKGSFNVEIHGSGLNRLLLFGFLIAARDFEESDLQVHGSGP